MQDLRQQLKRWERDFQREKGRRPTPSDIQSMASPGTIDRYKKYQRWKQETQTRDNAPVQLKNSAKSRLKSVLRRTQESTQLQQQPETKDPVADAAPAAASFLSPVRRVQVSAKDEILLAATPPHAAAHMSRRMGKNHQAANWFTQSLMEKTSSETQVNVITVSKTAVTTESSCEMKELSAEEQSMKENLQLSVSLLECTHQEETISTETQITTSSVEHAEELWKSPPAVRPGQLLFKSSSSTVRTRLFADRSTTTTMAVEGSMQSSSVSLSSSSAIVQTQTREEEEKEKEHKQRRMDLLFRSPAGGTDQKKRRLAFLLQSPGATQEHSDEDQDHDDDDAPKDDHSPTNTRLQPNGESTETSLVVSTAQQEVKPPEFSDDASSFHTSAEDDDEDEEATSRRKRRKKRPINGKRQTSRRKLQPIKDVDALVPTVEEVTKRQGRRGRGGKRGGGYAGVRLKLNRKGSRGKYQFVNHGLVDRYGPVGGQTVEYSQRRSELEIGENNENPFLEEGTSLEAVTEEVDSGDDSAGSVAGDVGESSSRRDDRPEETRGSDSGNRDVLCLGECYNKDAPTPDGPIELIAELKELFGFSRFRDGQQDCVERILRGRSTILILPTGAGKSLCYQLPAYILAHRVPNSMTLVVSPTISLMEDQVAQLPSSLRGACIASNQTAAQSKAVMERIRTGRCDILFVSPEKLMNGSFVTALASPEMPRIRFACIDEVHCLSEWSHNFRPSYLMVYSTLTQKLGVQCWLGLTGTATASTLRSLCHSLDLSLHKDVIQMPVIRENLHLSVSRDTNRKAALSQLLTSEPYVNYKSIIIYCMRQKDADEVAGYLRTKHEFKAESYHAGKEVKERTRIQKSFMSGRTHIICATIAFGLGINRRDVRAVIHYSMPKSLENYIQEIGRSGRDGKPAYCHLFTHDDDFLRMRSLAYTDSIGPIIVKRILNSTFHPPQSHETTHVMTIDEHYPSEGKRCVILDTGAMEIDLDVRKPVISTVLSYTMLHERHAIRLLPNIYLKYELVLYKLTRDQLSDKDATLAQLLQHAEESDRNVITVSTLDVCTMLKWSPYQLNEYLFSMHGKQWFTLRPKCEALHVRLEDDLLSPDRNDIKSFLMICDDVNKRMQALEKSSVMKIDQIYALACAVACPNVTKGDMTAQTDAIMLNQGIREYFDCQGSDEQEEQPEGLLSELVANQTVVQQHIDVKSLMVEQDLQDFIAHHADQVNSGLVIARIFHGLPSPRYPYQDWSDNRYWAKHIAFDFKVMVQMANRYLLEYHEKKDEP